MAAALIAVSFVCAVLLAVFLPVKRVYGDVPSLAIVFWLLLANILQGVNSTLFLDTVNVRSFVWCDISSKLLLGVNAAIPGALICVGRYMELVSSPRKMPSNPTVKRNMLIFDITLCYVLPVIYMCLHLIVQNHRFDIIEDFGCFAAVHPSTPGVILVWVLPLILAAVSLLLSGLAIHHSLRLSKGAFEAHLATRTTMSASIFSRRAATSIILTCISLITTLFSLFSIPVLIPWKSWAYAHADMGLAVVLDVDSIGSMQLRWWAILALSVSYIVLSFALGQETRDVYKWFRSVRWSTDAFVNSFKGIRMPRRPLRRKASESRILAPKASLPHMVELSSGWDDMVTFKPSGTKSTWSSLKKPKSIRSNATSPLSSPISSRSPSAASIRGERNIDSGPMTSEDRAFMHSTISYLGSPTAQTLGITPPLRCVTSDLLAVPRNAPSPVWSAAPSPSLIAPRSPIPPHPIVIADPVLPQDDTPEFQTSTTRSPTPKPASPQRRGNTVSSVIRAEWPMPPEVYSQTGSSVSRHSSRSSALTHSPTSSIEEVAGYVAYRAPSPTPHPHQVYTRPFEEAVYGGYAYGVPQSVHHVQLHHQQSPSASGSTFSGRTPSLKQSLRSLRESWNRDRAKHNSGQSNIDGIVMTVVQETV